MSSVVRNYKELLEEINFIAIKNGRDPKEITTIAVTKQHPWEEAAPLFEAGCRHFGENRLPEALSKQIIAPPEINWHMIGPLQRNKVAKAVEAFSWIHSVDSLELAEKISEESEKRGRKSRILLQVNTSGELSKQGFTAEECLRYFPLIYKLPGLDVQGLMTMAPFIEDENLIRDCFAKLRQLKDKIESEGFFLPHLSMGMSHDYKWAIAEGATFLRIGTAIFKP